jgi:hypothetical protein|tara:strand:+ start:1396 stop:1530 length:135 start_codon:yes stop_codon:yes gene_type:complete
MFFSIVNGQATTRRQDMRWHDGIIAIGEPTLFIEIEGGNEKDKD